MTRDALTESRRGILLKIGASESDSESILDYNSGVFNHSKLSEELSFPLEDELFAKSWRAYQEDAASLGVFSVIRKVCPQLNFPISDKTAESPEYKDAVLYANLKPERLEANDLGIKDADKMQLAVVQTDAGAIPMLHVPDREDFERVLKAMLYNNTDTAVPPWVTSAFVREFRNSERIAAHRERFQKKKALMNLNATWQDEFQKILLNKEQYLDSLIVVCGGYASNIPPEDFGLGHDEWIARSVVLGREKEALRYFMRRLFGIEKNHPYLEFIVTYGALKATFKMYDKENHLKLLLPPPESSVAVRGLDLSDKSLSQGAGELIRSLIIKAADNLADFEKIYAGQLEANDPKLMVISLTYVTMEEMASNLEPLEKIYFSLAE
ncbi:MAG: hypothetical protein JW808_00180 [Victivallales bacterium]|nr:hypothetical protein [Victivallales bacterium]